MFPPLGNGNNVGRGNQGPFGNQGPMRNQGPFGNQGPMRNQGPFGNQGPMGNPGPMGSQGPMGPPPRSVPQKPMRAGNSTFAVDASSIRNCVGRFTYIWLDNGQEFWMFPISVGRQSVAGFRWIPRFGWSYTGVSLSRIDFFTCV